MNIRLRTARMLFIVFIMTALSLYLLPAIAQDGCSGGTGQCADNTPAAVAGRSTPTATAQPAALASATATQLPELTGGSWTVYPLSVQSYGVDGVEHIEDASGAKTRSIDVEITGDTLTITSATKFLPTQLAEGMPDTLKLTTEDGVTYSVDVNTYTEDNGGYDLRLELTRVSDTLLTGVEHVSFFEYFFAADFMLATDNPDDDPRSDLTRCDGAPVSRLAEGDTALVLYGQGYNNMRAEAGLSSAKVGRIPEGDTFVVISGPVCKDGYAWYEVKHKNDSGWTAEGEDDTYWVWKEHVIEGQ